MTPDISISVVIPTIGRNSVAAAVDSALRQTVSLKEIIVVMDGEGEVPLPQSSPAVSIVRTAGRQGAGVARQVGIDAASGDVIALLDDDDVWHRNKLELQLAAIPDVLEWIVSCRFSAQRPGKKPVVIPEELIGDGVPVCEYIYLRRSFRFGRSSLQTSTLVFPRRIAQAVPWSTTAGSVNDDPQWLAAVQREFPDVRIVQIPDVLVDYGLTAESLSRSNRDRSTDYIEWGVRELRANSARVRGDYLLTGPVSAAVAAGSVGGVLRSMRAAAAYGRPGGWAWAYAGVAIPRIGIQQCRQMSFRPRGRVRT
jgi:hypothetical protein